MRQIAEAILDRIFPKSRLWVSPGLAARLQASPICLIDVGGAMGPEERWQALRPDFVRIMSFEPDARSLDDLDDNQQDVIVPIGLGAVPGGRTLYLTEGPFASSLYRPNEDVLRDFAVMPWYVAAGAVEIEIDTLEAVLERHPGWRADFIKVDVEGADLDVLKGAGHFLDAALGVQVEASVADRNISAPLQPELDLWLRSQGLIPFQFIREHWIRKNGVHGATSRPQLAWADVVYFRSRDAVIERMRAAGDNAPIELAHMLAILLAYAVHDYATELVEAALDEGLISSSDADDYNLAIKRSLVGHFGYTLRGMLALGLACLAWVPLQLVGPRGAAAASALVRTQAGPLFGSLYRAAGRGGLDASMIYDA